MANLSELIEETANGSFLLLAALKTAVESNAEEELVEFIKRVSEKGEGFWLRFEAFQKDNLGPKDMRPSFNDFIEYTLFPEDFDD